MCKIKYVHDDGTEFSTAEECQAYVALPRVYIVMKRVEDFSICTQRIVESYASMFLNYNEAVQFIKANTPDSAIRYNRATIITYRLHTEVLKPNPDSKPSQQYKQKQQQLTFYEKLQAIFT